MVNDEIIIEGTKKVHIRSIKQTLTYGGLLEGIPTRQMNERILKDVVNDARKFSCIDEVYLIEPAQIPIAYNGRYPFGEPAALPPVICIVELSGSPQRDMNRHGSCLALVWFQQDYMFPIDADILKKITEIPYSKVCGEFDH